MTVIKWSRVVLAHNVRGNTAPSMLMNMYLPPRQRLAWVERFASVRLRRRLAAHLGRQPVTQWSGPCSCHAAALPTIITLTHHHLASTRRAFVDYCTFIVFGVHLPLVALDAAFFHCARLLSSPTTSHHRLFFLTGHFLFSPSPKSIRS